MRSRNFHRIANPKAEVINFLKAESQKGNKVYWDRSHVQDGHGENHNNGGVGLYCVSAKPRSDEDQLCSYEPRRFMLLKSEDDVEEIFTYYEDDE